MADERDDDPGPLPQPPPSPYRSLQLPDAVRDALLHVPAVPPPPTVPPAPTVPPPPSAPPPPTVPPPPGVDDASALPPRPRPVRRTLGHTAPVPLPPVRRDPSRAGRTLGRAALAGVVVLVGVSVARGALDQRPSTPPTIRTTFASTSVVPRPTVTAPASTRPPTTVVAPTTSAAPRPTTTVAAPTTSAPRDPSVAFCAAYRRVARPAEVSATEYLDAFVVMAAEASASYRADYVALVSYFRGRLAALGPGHTGEELNGPAAQLPGNALRAAGYALACDRLP